MTVVGQSNAIFFFLFAAFFVFITVRGELPKYMGFLLSTPSTGSGTATPFTNAAGAINPTSLGGPTVSYNPANNAQSTVSADIGNAAITAARIAAF